MVSSLSPRTLRLFSSWKAWPTSKHGIHYLAGGGLGREVGLKKTERLWILRLTVLIVLYVIWARSFHCSETTRSAHGANDIQLCVTLFEHVSSVPLCNRHIVQFRENTGTGSEAWIQCVHGDLDRPLCFLNLVFLHYKTRIILSLSQVIVEIKWCNICERLLPAPGT